MAATRGWARRGRRGTPGRLGAFDAKCLRPGFLSTTRNATSGDDSSQGRAISKSHGRPPPRSAPPKHTWPKILGCSRARSNAMYFVRSRCNWPAVLRKPITRAQRRASTSPYILRRGYSTVPQIQLCTALTQQQHMHNPPRPSLSAALPRCQHHSLCTIGRGKHGQKGPPLCCTSTLRRHPDAMLCWLQQRESLLLGIELVLQRSHRCR